MVPDLTLGHVQMVPIYALTVEFVTYTRSASRRPAYSIDTPIPVISSARKFNTHGTNTPRIYVVTLFNNAYIVF
jgi:hypothetical protein